jgi:8-oxo-dGTP diphosphatase
MKIVTAAIIEDKGLFLIARRAHDQKLAGMWEFPGGKVEPGETLQECLKREITEELGANAIVGEVLTESHYKYQHGEILLVALKTELQSQELRLTVHDEFQWLTPKQILDLDLAPADIPIAKFLMEAVNDL